ncbi:MazG-like nucleotide pyrophosphohydrolase [Microbacterium phage Rona]|nr:MazG-like nucleotide pyrophosphohydrolase [Microbacterium phage Rona]
MTDTLQELLDAQSALQDKMPTPHPTDLFVEVLNRPRHCPEAVRFLEWNVTALTDELHELLGETGWKPWATSKHVNLDAARGEAIDALHFLLNIFLALGMSSREVMMAYRNKHAKNAKRQEDGYDGVSTKCPGCHRALDDDAVTCHVDPTGRLGDQVGVIICDVRGRAFPIADHPRGGTHLEGSFS